MPYSKTEKNPHQLVFAISGVKNSGKTTLLETLLPLLTNKGYSAAVIKHDGHEFEPDVPGTDTWRHQKAGALGTLVFSDSQFQLVKKQEISQKEDSQKATSHQELSKEEMEEKLSSYLDYFPEADFVLLEGLKHSSYPKLEIIRKGNSSKSVCRGYNLLAIASDYEQEELGQIWKESGNPEKEDDCFPVCFSLQDAEQIATFLIRLRRQKAAENCSLVILAGGKSSRMGQDKADLVWQGKTFLQHQIDKGLALGIKDIMISGYRGDWGKESEMGTDRASIRLIWDTIADSGPLAGMESAFGQARERRCLVLSVDTPLISEQDLEQLLLHNPFSCQKGEMNHGPRDLEKSKAVLLKAGGELQPLIGIYDTDLAEQIADILREERKSVKRLLDRIPFDVIESVNPEAALCNINDPGEYDSLLARKNTGENAINSI